MFVAHKCGFVRKLLMSATRRRNNGSSTPTSCCKQKSQKRPLLLLKEKFRMLLAAGRTLTGSAYLKNLQYCFRSLPLTLLQKIVRNFRRRQKRQTRKVLPKKKRKGNSCIFFLEILFADPPYTSPGRANMCMKYWGAGLLAAIVVPNKSK